MSELGRLLSEARAAKGASLAEVEAGTRIRQKYVEALETGSFDDLPRGAVARGFLRSYADYLGLDAEQVLQLYAQESGDTGSEVPIAEPGKPRYVDYRPLEVELHDKKPAPGWLRWIVALLVVVVLAAAGWWFLGRELATGWSSLAFWAEPTSTPTPTNTPTPWIVTATPPPATTAELVLSTPTSDLLLLPTPTVPATISPTPLPTDTPEIVAEIALSMTVSQRAWVRVDVDGEVVQEGILEQGENRFWNAVESIVVRTGNAGGVNLTLNGEDLGPLGDIGQVVERAWVVEQGQVSETQPETPTTTATPTSAGTPAPGAAPTSADTPEPGAAPTSADTPAAGAAPAETPTPVVSTPSA
jgi:cytoskeletal protein RodZ